eukprot:772658-Rhodomonas_salina.3
MNDSTGMWQARDVVVTDEKLFFAKQDAHTAIASINLWEITKISWLGGLERQGSSQALSRIDSLGESLTRKGPSQDADADAAEPLTRDASAFEIRTQLDGPSLGMRFKFKTNSLRHCKELIAELDM